MRGNPRILKSLAIAPAVALAGCAGSGSEGNAAEADANAESSGATTSTIAFSQSGWLTVGSDGAVQITFFDADGRYRDLRNGAELAGGGWEQRADGIVCFEPDAGLGDCWETGAADENGTIVATNSDGKTIAIKQVTYVAPPEPSDSDEGA